MQQAAENMRCTTVANLIIEVYVTSKSEYVVLPYRVRPHDSCKNKYGKMCALTQATRRQHVFDEQCFVQNVSKDKTKQNKTRPEKIRLNKTRNGEKIRH